MYRHFLKVILLSVIITCTFCIGASASCIGTTKVTTDKSGFHSAPSTVSPKLTTASKVSSMAFESKSSNGGYKIVYRGASDLCSANKSSCTNLEAYFEGGKNTNADSLLSDSSSLSLKPSGELESGTEMKVVGLCGGWYKVIYDSLTGYVSSDSLILDSSSVITLSENESTSSEKDNAESIGQNIVDTAKKFIGTRYVWGGTTPSGFDCSGFVKYVYSQYGYSLNRTAAGIYQEGTAVDKSALQAGDAVCFSSNTESIGHIGIYIGDGAFIHASSGGKGVMISNLDEAYFASRYVGARHLI